MKYVNSSVMALAAVALLSFVLNVFGQSMNNLIQQQAGGAVPSPTATPSMSSSVTPAAFVSASPSVSPSSFASPRSSPSPSVSPSVAAAATLDVRQDPALGSFLVDGAGKTLYLFMADSQNQSSCSGSCAAVWPPLVGPAGQNLKAGQGVNASLIGTTVRSDGSTQATYAGHPLYYYAPDQKPGDIFGQGINSFGAVWYLVNIDGTPLMGASAMTPSPSPSPSPSAVSGAAGGTAGSSSGNSGY